MYFFITFSEFGRVHFQIVNFGRDSPAEVIMQKSAGIAAKIPEGEFQPALYSQSSAEFSVSFLRKEL